DVLHSVYGFNGSFHLFVIELGRRLHENVDGTQKNVFRFFDDIERDKKRDDRVDPGKRREEDENDGSDDDADRGQRIGKKMQIARANVQAVIGMLMKKHDTDQIADESDDGDDEHPISLDGLRSIKA